MIILFEQPHYSDKEKHVFPLFHFRIITLNTEIYWELWKIENELKTIAANGVKDSCK